MSSGTCIAYFGLKIEISAEEVEGVELRSDQRVKAARGAGLKYYFGNFGGLQERYLLFVGDQIGLLGLENSESIGLSPEDVRERMDKTKAKLIAADFEGAPSLHLQWQPDI